MRPYIATPAKEIPSAQLVLAAGATQWDAVWALAQRYAQYGWDRAVNGESFILTEEERAQLFSWRGFIGRSCLDLSN